MIVFWLRLTRTYHPENYVGGFGRSLRNLDVAIANLKAATLLLAVATVLLIVRVAT